MAGSTHSTHRALEQDGDTHNAPKGMAGGGFGGPMALTGATVPPDIVHLLGMHVVCMRVLRFLSNLCC